MPSETGLTPLPPADTARASRRRRSIEAPAPPGPVVVRVAGLVAEYGARRVLDDLSFELRQGRVYSIIGPSGCGKTTLLKAMLGLRPANAGVLELLGVDIRSARPDAIEAVRKRIGVLFQGAALFSSMSVAENVALPLRQHTRLSPAEVTERVMHNLALVGLAEDAGKQPNELSGGMRKRVALARAIALEPALLFLDEPTSGADPVMAAVLDDLVLDLTRRIGATAIVVTHDMRSAFRLSHEILMLWNGRIHHKGAPADFIETDNPAINQFVQGRRNGPLVSLG